MNMTYTFLHDMYILYIYEKNELKRCAKLKIISPRDVKDQ